MLSRGARFPAERGCGAPGARGVLPRVLIFFRGNLTFGRDRDIICPDFLGECGCSLVVKLQPSKLATRVRFPPPAPKKVFSLS